MATIQQVVLHPYITQLLKFWSTTVGRDKSARSVQYLSRFLAYYTKTIGAPQEDVARWASIKSNISLSRKLFRIGRFLENFQAALKALSTTDRVIRALTVGRQLGYAGYLVLDALQWAYGAKALRFQKETYETFSKTAQRFWLFGLTCSLLNGLYKSYLLNERTRIAQRPRPTAEKESERRVELNQLGSETLGVRLQLLQDACDWINPASSLGFLGFSDGVVGLAGTVSSLLGARAQWVKVNGQK